MNPDEPIPTTSAERIAAQAAKSDPADPVAVPNKFPRVVILKPAPRKSATLPTADRPTNGPSLLVPANDPVIDEPVRAAEGDDDLASQPQKIP